MKLKLFWGLSLSSKVILFLLASCLAVLPNQKAHAFVVVIPGGHEGIDDSALGFLRSTIRTDINRGNTNQDLVHSDIDFRHFDNSNFGEGIKYINDQYSRVVANLNPASPQIFNLSTFQQDDDARATGNFGLLLHTVQDFYAHSNWVDYDPQNVPLFDGKPNQKPGLWAVHAPYSTVNRGGNVGDLLILQGKIPAGSNITGFKITDTLPAVGGGQIGTQNIKRLVEVLGNPHGATKGLVTGGFSNGTSNNANNQAPEGAKIEHGKTIPVIGSIPDEEQKASNRDTLNKDYPITTIPFNRTFLGRTNYIEAFNAASRQTQYEWCRLLHLTKDKQGFPGASIPMSLFVRQDGDPHPVGTPCQTNNPGSQNVQVTIDRIKVNNNVNPGGDENLNLSFVLYTNDFKRSVRTEQNSIKMEVTERDVPKEKLPAPLTLSVDQLNDAIITLQAWNDTANANGILERGDTILQGLTQEISKLDLKKPQHIIKQGDFDVCLTIKLLNKPEKLSSNQTSSSEGCLDFGDAPDVPQGKNYQTLLDSKGPRYQDGNFQRLGFGWDSELNGQPTLKADGDDKGPCACTGGEEFVDDEDGVEFGDNFVKVVFNITRPGINNYLFRAWWDTNKNDTFDHPTELYIDKVISLGPGITEPILFDLSKFNFDPRDFYSRFRLTWDPVDPDVKPFGEFVSSDGISYGEVEDYAPVPESSFNLSLLALGTLGAASTLKRKLKTSTPSGKETTKVS